MATDAGLKAQPSGTLRATGAPVGRPPRVARLHNSVHGTSCPHPFPEPDYELFEEAFDVRRTRSPARRVQIANVAECRVMYFEDLATDMSAGVSKLITERDVETFAAVSTDTNPIHLSDEFAAGTRFKRRIAHGLLTASLISAVLGTKLPGPGAIYVSQNLKFTAPVYLGDVVTATVTLVTLDSLHRHARFDCVCRVGSKMVLSGDAVLYVPNRPGELAAPTGPSAGRGALCASAFIG